MAIQDKSFHIGFFTNGDITIRVQENEGYKDIVHEKINPADVVNLAGPVGEIFGERAGNALALYARQAADEKVARINRLRESIEAQQFELQQLLTE